MILRLLPCLFILLCLTMTVRLNSVWQAVRYGGTIETAQAVAADEPTEDVADIVEKSQPKKKAAADTEEKADTAPSGQMADPFAPEYSDEELQVLQSLGARREQLDQRMKQLDEREKLLKAAETRMGEKYKELEAMKQEIETLLNKQQAVEEGRLKQLVRIYENMKPGDAARIFNELDFDVLLAVVNRMSERKAAPVIAQMDATRARELSAKIAAQQALPKQAGQ